MRKVPHASIEHFLAITALALQLSSCSTLSPVKKGQYSASELFGFACEPGKNIVSARGRVLAKMTSTEEAGQFQANVLVDSSDHLQLEITNPLGGTQALIKVSQGRYEIIDYSEKGQRPRVGQDHWGGIPLQWASILFLGQIPCPQRGKGLDLEVSQDNELTVTELNKKENEKQKFIYRFKQWNHHPWPASLKWIREGSERSSVEFQFDSPEKETGSPEKWDVRSSQGQIKVKWRTREITRD